MRCLQQFEYSQVGRWLMPLEMARLMGMIEKSGVLKIADELPTGQLSHVVFRGTQKPVGYLGADNQVERVNPDDISLRIAHAYLEGLYERCLDENQRIIKLQKCPHFQILN